MRYHVLDGHAASRLAFTGSTVDKSLDGSARALVERPQFVLESLQ